MSLKYFHLVFLAFAFLCDAGIWLWMHFLPEDASSAGITHLKPYVGLIAIGIVGYALWYIVRKMRTIIV